MFIWYKLDISCICTWVSILDDLSYYVRLWLIWSINNMLLARTQVIEIVKHMNWILEIVYHELE